MFLDSSTLVAQATSPSAAVVSLTAPNVQERVDVLRRDQACRRMLRQVPPFAVATQPIGDGRLHAASDKCSVQVGADEASAARDQYHAARYRLADESAKAAKELQP
jgi:hypothetical protein